MSTTYAGNDGGDLGALFGVLKRRAWIVVLTVVVAAVAAYGYTRIEHKTYTACAQLLFEPLYLDAQLTGLPLQLPSSDPTKEGGTDVGLVELPQVQDLAAQRLGNRYTPSQIKDNVSVSASSSSNLVSVCGSSRNPQSAALIANAVAGSFVDYRRNQLVTTINSATNTVNSELKQAGLNAAQIVILKADLTKLTLLAVDQPDDVQFVSQAQAPSKPSSPKTTLDVLIGALLGLVLGFAIAFGVEALDRRVRRPDELEEALELPLLANVPASRALRDGHGVATGLSGAEAEAFRFLRENLRYQSGERENRSVLITSAAPGSGKTTVALHLAAAAAAGTVGEVLLIEADLRRPRLSRMLGLPTDRGLSTLLRRPDETLEELVVAVPTGSERDLSRNGAEHLAGSFDVLGAGPPHPNASELLRSQRMRDLLHDAGQEYGLIIIDGPPPGFVSDAIPLMAHADGVVVVARVGHERGPELRRLRTELQRHGVEPLGVVANFSRPVNNPYAFIGR